MQDPIGRLLYEFGWESKRPGYINEDWFKQETQTAWKQLGENGREGFRNIYLMLGNKETQDFIEQASKEQLYSFWFAVEAVYNEQHKALSALYRMGNREMKKEEYLRWFGRFKLQLLQR